MRACSSPEDSVVDPNADLRSCYTEQFRCIGPDCEDTCCQNFNVKIDESTYAKYQSLPQGPLTSKIHKLIQITGEQTGWNHAEILFESQPTCPFLDSDSLCEIQKEHGSGYLSDTCSQYPRLKLAIDDLPDAALSISCPEAARFVLNHPKLMPGFSDGHDPSRRYRELQPFFAGLPRSAGDLKPYFWAIRRFVLLCLTDRSYSVGQRLFVIGMLAMRLQALVDEKQIGQAPKLLLQYAEIVASGSLRPVMSRIPAQPVLQLMLVLELLVKPVEKATFPSSRFSECRQRFLDGIGYQAGASPVSLSPAYQRAFKDNYLRWTQQNPTMLENYLVNAAIANMFPVGRFGSKQGLLPWREYLRLSIHYGLIQSLLIGMAGSSPFGLTPEDVIKLIQSFEKLIGHNATYIEETIALLEREGLSNTQGFAALICDPV